MIAFHYDLDRGGIVANLPHNLQIDKRKRPAKDTFGLKPYYQINSSQYSIT